MQSGHETAPRDGSGSGCPIGEGFGLPIPARVRCFQERARLEGLCFDTAGAMDEPTGNGRTAGRLRNVSRGGNNPPPPHLIPPWRVAYFPNFSQ